MTNIVCALEDLENVTKIQIKGIKPSAQFRIPGRYIYTIDYYVCCTDSYSNKIVYNYSITESMSQPPREILTERMMKKMTDLEEIILINIHDFVIHEAADCGSVTNKKIKLIDCSGITHVRAQ